MITVKDMSIDELEKLKQQRYQAAMDNGTLAMIGTVARELGHPQQVQYGPKWLWSADGISIYIDGYGRYLTVCSDNKKVCSTHRAEEFIVPGAWIDRVASYFPEALKNREEKEQSLSDHKHKLLLEQLL